LRNIANHKINKFNCKCDFYYSN